MHRGEVDLLGLDQMSEPFWSGHNQIDLHNTTMLAANRPVSLAHFLHPTQHSFTVYTSHFFV